MTRITNHDAMQKQEKGEAFIPREQKGYDSRAMVGVWGVLRGMNELHQLE